MHKKLEIGVASVWLGTKNVKIFLLLCIALFLFYVSHGMQDKKQQTGVSWVVIVMFLARGKKGWMLKLEGSLPGLVMTRCGNMMEVGSRR